MAKMPVLLRLLIAVSLMTFSGCASWHFRKDGKSQNTASTNRSANSSEVDPIVWNLANASLHGWNFNSRW